MTGPDILNFAVVAISALCIAGFLFTEDRFRH